MAAMSTTLNEFSDNGDSRTYSYTGHSISDPKLVIQKRKVPTTVNGVYESTVKVVSGTEDANGEVLPQKVTFEVVVRGPVAGISGDVTAALAVFRDVIAGDEFTNTVTTQEWLV